MIGLLLLLDSETLLEAVLVMPLLFVVDWEAANAPAVTGM